MLGLAHWLVCLCMDTNMILQMERYKCKIINLHIIVHTHVHTHTHTHTQEDLGSLGLATCPAATLAVLFLSQEKTGFSGLGASTSAIGRRSMIHQNTLVHALHTCTYI